MIYYNEILNDFILIIVNPNNLYFLICFQRELEAFIQNWEVPIVNMKLEETMGHLIASGYEMIGVF